MGLINDDQIKMTGSEEFLSIIGFFVIDGIHDSRVCGENGPVCRFVFSALQQIAGGQIRHVLYKCLFCLLHEFATVCKEQNICDPSMILQHIHEGNGSTGFAGSCCHDKKSFSFFLGEVAANALNSSFLVVAVCDFWIDIELPKFFLQSAPVNDSLDILLREDGVHLPLGIVQIIP